MFNNAVNGLKILKQSYSTYATIQHTIDYYIIVLMQRNNDLISLLGINILDINKITDVVCNKNQPGVELTQVQLPQQAPQQSTKKNGKKDTSTAATLNADNASNTALSKTIVADSSELEKVDDVVVNQQQKDIYKFLFELWNDREIKIVINLFKELEAKQHTGEKDYIYTNLMQYCEMKENKLYNYIEENSSVL
jgi:hypothetical protein